MTVQNSGDAENGDKDLLRFLTCGSVDDGKSTLIGRLLYDCALILDDQMATLERESRRFGTAGEDGKPPDIKVKPESHSFEQSAVSNAYSWWL